MCLGIPMQIMEIAGSMARCARGGVERDVNLFLVHDRGLAAGDYVLVHVGYAIQKIDTAEAQTILEWCRQMQGAGDA